MVELEQMGEGYYFLLAGDEIRITSAHFQDAAILCLDLDPIIIEMRQLLRLRFSTLNYARCEYIRETGTGRTMVLHRHKTGKWKVILDGQETQTYIYHIHELQRLYFSHFQELLRFMGDNPAPIQTKEYQYKEHTKINYVDAGPGGTRRYPNARLYNSIEVSVPDDDYYLTYDCRLLVRSGKYAIWRVAEKSPLFEYQG